MPGARIQLKRAPAASWTSSNPVLFAGEVGVETDTRKMKIGDGSTPWSNLQYAKPHIGELSVNDLQDVVVTSASVGQVLKFNGQQWVNDSDSAGTTISSIDDINDVVITQVQSGQVLKFNGQQWVNASDSTGTTISSIDDINDVVITSASNGQVLQYNGTNWVNAEPTGGTATMTIHPFAMLG